MDVIVLAGGYATRMWPITRHRPKMLLPIGDSTVIDRIFAELENDDRVDRVYVSTNERFAGAFRDHLEQSGFRKPRLSVEATTDEDEKPGVVGALAQLVEREGIGDDTLVVAGDNLMGFALSEFVDFFLDRGTPTIAAYDVGSRDRAGEYGVVDLEGARVVDFQEKPDDPPSSLVSIACYGFPAESIGLLGTYLEGENNPDEPGWFVQWLVERERVHAFTFDEAWFDIGTPRSYLDAVAWYLDGGTLVHPEATVEGSNLGGNVHVMRGAEVVDCDLERAVIFPEVTLRSCEIRSSIIDEETVLEGLDLAGAQIGAHTKIANGGVE